MWAAIRVSHRTNYAALHKRQGKISDSLQKLDVASSLRGPRALAPAGHEGVEGDPELIAKLVLLHEDFVLGARDPEMRRRLHPA